MKSGNYRNGDLNKLENSKNPGFSELNRKLFSFGSISLKKSVGPK